jgi:hypothetical protein
MTTPEVARMEFFRQVRVVLVRHMIDIGQLSIRISMNHLHLHGSLCRLPGVTTELTPTIIRTIFSELGLIRGIKRVDGEFDNWQQLDQFGAAWAPIQSKKMIAPPSAPAAPEVLDVSDADKPDSPAG